MLWKCPDYKDSRNIFMIKLRDLLGESWALLRDLLFYVVSFARRTLNYCIICSGGIHILDQVRKVKLYGTPGSTQQLQQLFEYYYYSCP